MSFGYDVAVVMAMVRPSQAGLGDHHDLTDARGRRLAMFDTVELVRPRPPTLVMDSVLSFCLTICSTPAALFGG
jgi:hypothetical protein